MSLSVKHTIDESTNRLAALISLAMDVSGCRPTCIGHHWLQWICNRSLRIYAYKPIRYFVCACALGQVKPIPIWSANSQFALTTHVHM